MKTPTISLSWHRRLIARLRGEMRAQAKRDALSVVAINAELEATKRLVRLQREDANAEQTLHRVRQIMAGIVVDHSDTLSQDLIDEIEDALYRGISRHPVRDSFVRAHVQDTIGRNNVH